MREENSKEIAFAPKNKKETVRKRLAAGLILAGICVIAFPFLKEGYEDWQQRRLLAAYEQALGNLDSGEVSEGADAEETEREMGTADAAERAGDLASIDASLVLGILQIDAIALKQPILKGATAEHLNLSVAAIEPATEAGQEGNLVVAGHHSRKYNRHFNRLEELKAGDQVSVQTQDGSYTYEITECFIVEADETQVLLSKEGKSEITLITCHYPKEGETQRFIARGELTSR